MFTNIIGYKTCTIVVDISVNLFHCKETDVPLQQVLNDTILSKRIGSSTVEVYYNGTVHAMFTILDLQFKLFTKQSLICNHCVSKIFSSSDLMSIPQHY